MKSLISGCLLGLLPAILFSDYHPCIDINFTPYSGAENLIVFQKGFEKLENIILPSPSTVRPQNFKEHVELYHGFRERTLIGAKGMFFWIPFNASCVVTQHEIFGHGYRIRDLGSKYAKVRGYAMYVFFGATSFETTNKLTVSQSIAIDIAGLEADSILAQKVRMKWLSEGHIDARQSVLYTLSALSLTGYSLLVKENATTIPQTGNDIINFLFQINTLYRDAYLSYRRLINSSLINLIDPFFIYSTISQIYYINYGLDMEIPMFKIGDIRYLPAPRLALTPFGMQWYLDNFFIKDAIPTYVYFKWGQHGGNVYYGCGVENSSIFKWETGSLGCRLDLWRQPHVLFQQGALSSQEIRELPEGTPVANIPELYPSSALSKRLWGGAFSLIGTYGRSKWPGRLYFELGYKSDGYLPGEALRASPIARGGLSGQF